MKQILCLDQGAFAKHWILENYPEHFDSEGSPVIFLPGECALDGAFSPDEYECGSVSGFDHDFRKEGWNILNEYTIGLGVNSLVIRLWVELVTRELCLAIGKCVFLTLKSYDLCSPFFSIY